MAPYLSVMAPHAPTIATLGLGCAVIYLVARCIYLLYFHPLAKYPGPKLAAVSDLWTYLNSRSGRGCLNMKQLHLKHGGAVRTGPNRLSFCTPQAYKDIYGHVKHGEKRFLKNKWYELDEPRIVRVRDPAAHAEQRRALAHAFSARALRDQEVVIHQYVDLLMKQLKKLGDGGSKPVDVSRAWSWMTFDVIGDLAFGEPFDAVAEASDSEFNLVYAYLKYTSARRTAQKFGSLLEPLFLRLALPAAIHDAAGKHTKLATAKARRRIALGDMDRADFFSHLLKGGKMTEGALIGNADTLLIAGSDTTATTLTGLTWMLLSNPHTLRRLTDEVRAAFASQADITGDTTSPSRVPYLHACIEEGLRIFPAVTINLPRDCPGAVIDGSYVPEGTIVGSETYTMQTHPDNWTDPDAFRPERWLDAEGKNMAAEGSGPFASDDRRAFQPFSTGPRACLGLNMAYLEMRVVVAKLVWLYDLEMVSKIDDLHRACEDVGVWKKPPMMVKFHPRVLA